MPDLNKRNFFIAARITLAVALACIACSVVIGKDNFFLLLNNDYGQVADWFFYIITYGGDGIIWVPFMLAMLFLLKRKDAWILVLSTILVGTLLVQTVKNVILPQALRPTRAITDASLIHTVDGVDIHTIGSFPSGHTTTAFCVYLLLCLLLSKRWWIPVGFCYALLTGYSRVYLAQHFPIDVAGGMIAAVVTVAIAIRIQQRWWQRRRDGSDAG